jgi:hypothetical protein
MEDLTFLVRAENSLPRELLEPIPMYPVVQPQAVAVPAPDTKVERPERAGGRWSEAEEIKLSGHFKSGMDVADISKLMERSPAPIVSRLLKLDLIVVQAKS